MADLSKVIIFHTLSDAIDALRLADELSIPILLQSAPDALKYAGSLYLLELFKSAKHAVPDADATFILDCGDQAALAISAMNDGHRTIRYQLSARSAKKIADIAKQSGVMVMNTPQKTIDTRHMYNIETQLRELLLCD